MISKSRRIAGVFLSGLIAVFLIGLSGVSKFIDWPGKAEMNKHMGIDTNLMPAIGTIEIVFTLLFLIPRTSFLGAILLTAYLGGAIMTHLRVGDPWFFPIIIGVFLWVTLGIRNPAIFSLALGKSVTPTVDKHLQEMSS